MNHRFLRLSLSTFALAITARAQCGTQWHHEGLGLHGVDGPVSATASWDPDGPGPAPAVLVVGGRFGVAGTVAAQGLATYDLATGTWAELGGGIRHATRTADVTALAVAANGDLIVAGTFDSAGSSAVANIARWNGTAWSPLGSGVDASVQSLCVLANGDLVAGGWFLFAGGQPASRIARWDGTAWHAMGTGCNATVLALARRPNGDLVVGGSFTTANGLVVNHLARWDGAGWHSFGSGVASLPMSNGPDVAALLTLANGDLAVGGSFDVVDGVPANSLARWDGTTWRSLSLGNGDIVVSLAQLPQGDVLANTWGGIYSDIKRWNGTYWQHNVAFSIGGFGPLTVLPSGDLILAGAFSSFSIPTGPMSSTSFQAANIARWDQQQFHILGLGGVNGPVLTTTHTSTGSLAIAGHFSSVQGTPCFNIAVRSGSSWQPLGTGTDGPVHVLVTRANGDLFAAGSFTMAGGLPVNFIARWDGAAWHALGSGLSGPVHSLVWLPNGDLIAGGWFTTAGATTVNHVARWDGATWHALGNGLPIAFPQGTPVAALLVRANGDLIAGGSFPGAVARWDGTAWQTIGGGWSGPFPWSPPAVYALTETANGHLIAGGSIGTGGFGSVVVSQWNGTNWQTLGAPFNNTVSALTTLPSGDVLAGGPFTAVGSAANAIARWNGSTWLAVGNGVNGSVAAFAHEPDGDVLVGGEGPVSSGVLVRLTTTCPALATPSGNGCTGSGGANVLTATSLPWIGATFTATATGMPANGLALRVLGLTTTSTPLSAILPQGTPGCSLLVTPTLLDLYVPTAGTVATSSAIPNALALANQVLHQQVVALELDPLASIVALTNTNALTLTIGAF